MGKAERKGIEAVSCLSGDDEEKRKLPWLWADAGCSASWWGVGPPVSGSPHLPLLYCGESDRWSPKVLLWSQRCFFSLSSSLPPRPEGTAPGEHGDGARHPALHRHKGQLLTERGRPSASFSHKHSATSPWM